VAQGCASALPPETVLDARREVAVHPFTGAEVSATSIPMLDSLCQAYRDGQICLFTGAGVSFTTAKHYKSPGWWDLLMETYGQMNPAWGEEELKERFAELKEQHPRAWDLASALAREAGNEDAFLAIMRRVLVGRTGGDARYKRLPKLYLDKAGTLNAAIAFCSRLRALRSNPCFEPNPDVAAVLTLNYDWFFEGGATQKYNANRFKPMASTKSELVPRRMPVYHIHGYVPHGIDRLPRHPLVLTAESYRQAYEARTFTTCTLDRLLGKFPALFVGVSFDDELLLRRLEKLAAKPGAPTHFALARQDSLPAARLARLRGAGVQPILYTDHRVVPAVLGRVYFTRMATEDLSVPVESVTGKRIGYELLSRQDYWRLLLYNKP
jgi:hypothetical protein